MVKLISSETHIAILFTLLALSYPFQVIFETLLISKFLYTWICFVALYFIFTNGSQKKSYDKTSYILFIYCFIVLFGSIQDYIHTKNILEFSRLLLLYLFPVVFFFYLVKKCSINYLFLLNFFIIISSLISIETIYEFFMLTEFTYFQELNFKYVENVTGKIPLHLMPNIRENGLMSHPHVSSLFIGFGVLICTIFFFKSNRFLYLLLLGINFIGLISSGIRLTLIAVVFFLVVFLYFTFRNNKIIWGKLFLVYTLAFFSLYLCSFQYTQFWITVYFQYLPSELFDIVYSDDAFFTNSMKAEINQSIYYATNNDSISSLKNVAKEYEFIPSSDRSHGVLPLLFGIGFGSYGQHLDIINDNLFFLQLVYQLGLVGTGILLYFIFMAYWKGFKILLNNMDENLQIIILISLSFITLVFFSLLHSGVFVKKEVYALMFFFIFQVNHCYKKVNNENIN